MAKKTPVKKKKVAPDPEPAKTGPGSARARFLTDLVDNLVKETGEGTAQLLGSDGLAIKIRGVLSTGCSTIDAAIGRGGIPYGRLTIIHGDEGSGKTTLALHLVAECQKRGGIVLYLDKEHKLDPDYAKKLGVIVEEIIISQPNHLEDCFKIFEATVEKSRVYREQTGERVPILVILDSMNAAISKAEFEGEYEDNHYAPGARVYSKSLPKLIPVASKEDVALVFISQVRQKIGVMFGRKDDIGGGRGPKFYASLILEIKRTGSITIGANKKKGIKGETVGSHSEVYVRKNQIAPPFRAGVFDIIYGKGIDKTGALIARATQLGIVEASGAWLSWGDERLGQGQRAAVEALEGNPAWLKQLEEAVEAKEVWTKKGKEEK